MTPLYPVSHKTVFVLDHGPYFALPCQQVEYDVGRRTGPGFIPLTPITKTVWTSAVEAVAEELLSLFELVSDIGVACMGLETDDLARW